MFLFWWRCKYIRCRYNARTDDFHYYLTIFHYTLLYSVFSIILSRKRKCRTLPLSPPAPPRPPLPTTATKSPSPARLTPTLLSTSTNPVRPLPPSMHKQYEILTKTVANIGSVSTFSLRSIQHTDHEGRVITEPDLSNPTRHRFERPLDTIRNFEAAIDRRRREMY